VTKNISIKVLLSVVIPMAIVYAMLFGIAGSFDYWQAWTLLAVSIATGIPANLYLWKSHPALMERRMKAVRGPNAESRPAQKLLILLWYVGWIALLVVCAIDHRLRWSAESPVLVVVGDVLILAGAYVQILAFRENSFASATIEIATDQRVVSTGPYAAVRHPMYSGFLLMLPGLPLALGSYWGLVLVVPLVLLIVWRLVDEERYLAESLPGYAEYRSLVRWRLIPALF
jgi:protein-S-isoprenylcysteine O-methyltransferase Ste14